MKNLRGQSWLSWAFVGVLAVLCAFLALMQNHWIAQVTLAERERLQQQLQNELNHLGRDFNSEITRACTGLMPSEQEVDGLGREKAYSNRYAQWKPSHDGIFSRIALAVPDGNSLELVNLDLNNDEFSRANWPSEWTSLHDELLARINRQRVDPTAQESRNVISLPRFGRPPGGNEPGPRIEQEWLVLELNLAHVRNTMLPELLRRYLSAGGNRLEYQALVVESSDPSRVIYESSPDHRERIRKSADASVPLFNIDYGALIRFRERAEGGFPGGRRPGMRDMGRPPGMMRPPPHGMPGSGMGAPLGGPPHGPPLERPGNPAFMGPGRWNLLVRHQAGSLEAVVSRARWQNLATSLGVLVLILVTVAALVRFSRRSQQLAELQMNFVAGVSHELRTPLTVIRTAAFNLRGKLASKPEQVEQYGELIQGETEKLSALVEQILRFAGARAGHAIRAREPVAIDTMIEDGLRSSGVSISDYVVEKKVEPGLPLVLADQMAMRYAIKNLVENAMKYGTDESKWIGISASASNEPDGAAVEVRVADHGPGIPREEQEYIFDPFFRGKRAVQDQVHGTGLGLNLVKKIVEAHGGTIRVESEPMKGTEFVMRIPAAPPEAA